MRTGKGIAAALTAVALALALGDTALANSSWHWLTDTRPYEVLPFAAAATVAIEFAAIYFIARVKRPWKTLLVVVIANLLSFGLPYPILLASPASSYTLDRLPYLIGPLYLIVTLALELPVTILSLRKDAPGDKRLVLTVIAANAVTTAMCAVIERAYSHGSW